MKSTGIGHTPCTPSVFCAVSAVIAVAAKPPSAVTALMSAWMPAPPPESEPATIRTRPRFTPALGPRAIASRQRLRPCVHQLLVLALGHHADHRLGAAGADQDAAALAEPRLVRGDLALHLGVLQRRGAGVAHVHQALRQRREQRQTSLAGRPPSTSTASTCSAAISPSPVVRNRSGSCGRTARRPRCSRSRASARRHSGRRHWSAAGRARATAGSARAPCST